MKYEDIYNKEDIDREDFETGLKANELRLGNLIHCWSDAGPYTFVVKIIPVDSGFNYSGIPIDKKILLKSGFKKRGTNEDYKMGALRIAKCWDNKYRMITNLFDSVEDEPDCTNVHQLQNLFYSLTGTELNVQL